MKNSMRQKILTFMAQSENQITMQSLLGGNQG